MDRVDGKKRGSKRKGDDIACYDGDAMMVGCGPTMATAIPSGILCSAIAIEIARPDRGWKSVHIIA